MTIRESKNKKIITKNSKPKKPIAVVKSDRNEKHSENFGDELNDGGLPDKIKEKKKTKMDSFIKGMNIIDKNI